MRTATRVYKEDRRYRRGEQGLGRGLGSGRVGHFISGHLWVPTKRVAAPRRVSRRAAAVGEQEVKWRRSSWLTECHG